MYTEPTIILPDAPADILIPEPRIVRPSPTIAASRGPLIKIPRVKWERDPAMSELIDHFDEPGRFHDNKKIKTDADRYQLLTVAEIQTIQTIAGKCRDDFSYASRNFFWITNKRRGEQLFRLWESQELIYEHLQRLKAKGMLLKIMILKARQLGCSTLIEGLIAWKTMFFKNVNAIVVSFDPEHAAHLFGIMQYIYDRMPWWLKPQCSSREYKDGLRFENPDENERRRNPGLNSQISVQAANKRTGVGQGTRISAAHLSEYSDWNQDYARDVIEEDLGNALAEDDPDMFAILESTAKGTGNYSYTLWKKNIELAENAEWYPLFLPFFFESTRFIAPAAGWRPEQAETDMRERVKVDWLRCNNRDCLQYHERFHKIEDMSETPCPTCGTGVLYPFELSDGQLRWMQRKRKNAEKDLDSLKKLRQEMCSTAIEAFQTSGIQVFGEAAQEFANHCVRPPKKEGFLDKAGKMHGCNPYNRRLNSATGDYYEACYLEGCNADHTWGDEHNESPLQIWREPEKTGRYVIGADVAEGLGGEGDFSVGFVLKVSQTGGIDEQVAMFRSNLTDTIAFAHVLNHLGRAYCGEDSGALIAVENNKYDTTLTHLCFQLQYPNLYRMKNINFMNPQTNKLGWSTQANSKPRLWQTFKRALQQKLVIVYSQVMAEEMKTFVKEDYSTRTTGSEGESHDDALMAGMIALYCAHENDWDDSVNQMNFRRELTLEEAAWHFSCDACSLVWPEAQTKDAQQCPRCKSRMIRATPNRDAVTADKQGNPFLAGDINRYEAQEYVVSMELSEKKMPEYEDL